MSARVFGLETEYGIVCADTTVSGCNADDSCLPTPQESAQLLFRHRPSGHRHNNFFLPNGGRAYLDIGSHPEYATPECSCISDLVAAEQAGDLLLKQMAQRSDQTLACQGVAGRIHLLKNNNDSIGNTYGCHENYSFKRDIDFQEILGPFLAFLATRNLLIGAGDFTATDYIDGLGEDKEQNFGFSTRAKHLQASTSADPTRLRGLLNTRDEPHADQTRWRRLHVICADTNICDITTALKVGLTMLVLSILENPSSRAYRKLKELTLVDPIVALHQLNRNGKRAVELTDGSSITGVEIQEQFVQVMRQWADENGPTIGPTSQTDYLFELAERTLQAISCGDWRPISTEIDWAIKCRLYQEWSQRHGKQWDKLALARVDLAYHDLSEQGLATVLRKQGLMGRFVKQHQVWQALKTAPPTRAQVRGNFIAAAMEKGADYAVSWDRVRLDSPPMPEIDLPDPVASNNPAVDQLIIKISQLTPAESTWVDPIGKEGLGVPG